MLRSAQRSSDARSRGGWRHGGIARAIAAALAVGSLTSVSSVTSISSVAERSASAGEAGGAALWVRPEDFRQPADGDNWAPAFTRAIDASVVPSGPMKEFAQKVMGGRIMLAPRTYRFTEPLYVHRSVVLEGAGVSAESSGTVLHFASGTAGVIVDYGSFSEIKNLAIVGTKGGPNANGLEIRGRLHVDQILVSGFSGHGVFINADVHHQGNANGWSFFRSRIAKCGDDADHDLFRVQGGDTNAGVAIGNELSSSKGWCVNDHSFLGNTYLGNRAADCQAGAYNSTNPNSRNLWLNNYAEGSKPSTINLPGTWIGGNERPNGNGYIVQDGTLNERWRLANLLGHPYVYSYLGTTDNTPSVVEELGVEGDPRRYQLRYGVAGPGSWGYQYGHGAQWVPVGVTDDKSKLGAGQAILPNGFYAGPLGPDGRPAVHEIFAPTKTDGPCTKGDDYHVPWPKAGECGEYRCTVDGQWKCTARLDP
jgi:hypothetical protein